MLRSSGGNGVSQTKTSGAPRRDRQRAGITSWRMARRLPFQGNRGLSRRRRLFLFLESSTPCLALVNSSFSGYTRPPSSRIDAAVLGVVARFHPGVDQRLLASLRALSFTHSRVACSVLTTNSYWPVSGASSEPSQRIENSWARTCPARGSLAEVELHHRVDPVDHPLPSPAFAVP